MHILGAYVHIHTKYEVSILWLGGLCTDADDEANDTDNYARWTNHDYIGSFGRIPNEPKIACFSLEKLANVNKP